MTPNLALMKCYRMLRNSRFTAFTVSELLRENQQDRGELPPSPHTTTTTQIRVNKVADLRPEILCKKRLRPRSFSVNFAVFLRTSFIQNTSGRVHVTMYII